MDRPNPWRWRRVLAEITPGIALSLVALAVVLTSR